MHSLGICYHLQLKLAQAQTCYEVTFCCLMSYSSLFRFYSFFCNFAMQHSLKSLFLSFLVNIIKQFENRPQAIVCRNDNICYL